MPEGPEVRIMADEVATKIKGRVLMGLYVYAGSRYKEQETPPLPLLVVDVVTHGKKLIIVMERNYFFLCSFGMEGRFLFQEGRYGGVRFDFSEGLSIWFDDSRKFGSVLFLSGENEGLAKKLSDVGPDIFQISLADFSGNLTKGRNYKESIACRLVDQKRISGIGNYLRAEILYRSKISPLRSVGSLTPDEIGNLYETAGLVYQESYRVGGHTLHSWERPDGTVGGFNCLVYGRTTDDQGNRIVSYKDPKGRTMWWCPTIQN